MKILLIDKCQDCKWCKTQFFLQCWECTHLEAPMLLTSNTAPIPPFCPLEDKEEE